METLQQQQEYILVCSFSRQEKHDRMKRLKRLTELECAMCESIGETPQLTAKWQSQTLPSEEQLVSFRKRIEELEETKVLPVSV